jgi:excisionase family DNA binding protein
MSDANHRPGFGLTLDPEALRPLIVEIVEQVVARLEAARAQIPERLAFSEAEAARLLGLGRHQLREERRRGRISSHRVVGKQVRYAHQDLLAYLTQAR